MKFDPSFLLSLLLLVGLTGCATTKNRYQVGVGNSHTEQPIQNVTLKIDGAEEATFERIGAVKTAGLEPRKGDLPETVTVSWTDASGAAHQQTAKVEVADYDGFSGNLLFQISSDNQLQLYPVPAVQQEWSVIPWAAPEAWEGAIGIPGLEAN